MRIFIALALLVSPATADEILRLSPQKWKRVPGGKEVDAIYGDYLLSNDKVVAIVADTVPGRNANMSCRSVQGNGGMPQLDGRRPRPALVNGRPDPKLGYTREANPGMFHRGPVILSEKMGIDLKTDAHLIVVALGEHSTVGPIMGQDVEAPCAVSNASFVDADGGGFTSNKDTLDAPLPVKKTPSR